MAITPPPQNNTLWQNALLSIIGLVLSVSFFLYDGTQEYELYNQILAGIGTIVIFCWLVVSRIAATPSTKNLLESILQIMMAFLLCVSTNLLFTQVDSRIDMTQSKQHTLSAQSKAILNDLQEPIHMIGFFGTGSPEENVFRTILDAMQAETQQITSTLYDPNQEPLLARQYGVRSLAEVVLTKGDQKRKIDEFFTEERFIQEVLSLSNGTTHQICFTTGHQELNLEEYEQLNSMRIVLDKLESQNYTAKIINILQSKEIPSSCSTLVIAGPQLDFSSFELSLIANYIAQGNNLYALLDVGSSPMLCASFAQYGIILKDNAILETNPKNQVSGGDYSYAVLNTTDFAMHPTAKTLATNILMQGIRSVEIDDDNVDQSLLELACTSKESWAETEYENGPIEKTTGIDIFGPVPVFAIAEIEDPEKIDITFTTPLLSVDTEAPPQEEIVRQDQKGGKIIVVGSSSLVLDEFTQRGDLGNLDLFLNGISWMSDETEQLHTRSKTQDITPFLVHPGQIQIIMIVSLLLTPATLLLGALSTWFWKRKGQEKG